MTKHPGVFTETEILLPNFEQIDPTRWAVVACDQYTSEPAYWEAVAKTVGDAPSALNLILPEVYLSETEARVPAIHRAMEEALKHLVSHPDSMLFLYRRQSDGTYRSGIIGAVDLECYDFHRGSQSLIRATEGTVLERIPPRVAVRRGAPLELPHVMLLIDDPKRTVIEPTLITCRERWPIYNFDLMQGGGHACAYLLEDFEIEKVKRALSELITPEAIGERYGDPTLSPLLFAVGDGNHSLATAKTAYEEIKAAIGEEAARSHPARYALVEVVNLHDNALNFEPIYRVVFGVDPVTFTNELEASLTALNGDAAPQKMLAVSGAWERELIAEHPTRQLAVGTIQEFLDGYLARHPDAVVDYIHGEDSLRALASRDDAVGLLFDGMRKDELFRTVIYDGALPRKTFSMGHAPDKRYYIECRRIK